MKTIRAGELELQGIALLMLFDIPGKTVDMKAVIAEGHDVLDSSSEDQRKADVSFKDLVFRRKLLDATAGYVVASVPGSGGGGGGEHERSHSSLSSWGDEIRFEDDSLAVNVLGDSWNGELLSATDSVAKVLPRTELKTSLLLKPAGGEEQEHRKMIWAASFLIWVDQNPPILADQHRIFVKGPPALYEEGQTADYFAAVYARDDKGNPIGKDLSKYGKYTWKPSGEKDKRISIKTEQKGRKAVFAVNMKIPQQTLDADGKAVDLIEDVEITVSFVQEGEGDAPKNPPTHTFKVSLEPLRVIRIGIRFLDGDGSPQALKDAAFWTGALEKTNKIWKKGGLKFILANVPAGKKNITPDAEWTENGIFKTNQFQNLIAGRVLNDGAMRKMVNIVRVRAIQGELDGLAPRATGTAVLISDRTMWSDDNLSGVLAHELGHVVGGLYDLYSGSPVPVPEAQLALIKASTINTPIDPRLTEFSDFLMGAVGLNTLSRHEAGTAYGTAGNLFPRIGVVSK
ncbi:MAG: hypothetical protein ACYTAF_06080 [Planctomycetota bacterium]